MSSFLRDPLALKELSGLSRRWQTYLARGVYVGLLGLILGQFWFTVTSFSSFASPSEYADLSRRIFHDFVRLQMLFVTLTAILSAADTIPREFQRGMMGVLTLTPLTFHEIVMGKWKAVMAQAGSLIFCGVPVVAICVYLGGVGLWEMVWSLSLTAATAAVA